MTHTFAQVPALVLPDFSCQWILLPDLCTSFNGLSQLVTKHRKFMQLCDSAGLKTKHCKFTQLPESAQNNRNILQLSESVCMHIAAMPDLSKGPNVCATLEGQYWHKRTERGEECCKLQPANETHHLVHR